MVLEIINNALDFVFWPVLKLPPFWSILVISIAISLLITVIYKYTTDQNLMKQMKTELKALQAQMKTLKEHPEEMKKVQGEMMKINSKFMMESMKPMLYYMIPIIFIFGWLNAHMAYDPINPGNEFRVLIEKQQNNTQNIELKTLPEGLEMIKNIDGQFTLKGKEGEYLLEFNSGNKTYKQTVIISKNKKYSEPLQTVNDETIKTIKTELKETIAMNLFGWKLGWLGTYIILSIITGSLLRKVMKVY